MLDRFTPLGTTLFAFLAMALSSGAAPALAVPMVEPSAADVERCGRLEGAPRQTCMTVHRVQALKFPAPEAAGTRPTQRMGIWRPAGAGPFPVVLIIHACPGLRPQVAGTQIVGWAEAALARGYAVMLLDTYAQRELPEGICGPTPELRVPAHLLIVRDAFAALDHLATLDFVDPKRVAAVGFSQGGRAAYLLGSKSIANVYSPSGRRFAAAVSVYGECFNRRTKIDNVRPDIDVPVLSLLGERDEDGDPRECLPRLQAAKDKGAPVAWHVFPSVGHQWDDERSRTPNRAPYADSPSGTIYRVYDAQVTEQSRKMTFDFTANAMKP